METRKFVVKELDKKDFTHKDAIRAVKCWWVIYTDFGGYTENEMTLHKWEDGAITISEGDNFLSISDKESLDVLREFLK